MKSLLLFLLSLIFCLSTSLADTRGIRKVEIKTKAGETVGLYSESHALVIGVSNYTNGWPKLPGVINQDAVAVLYRFCQMIESTHNVALFGVFE